MAKKKLFPKMAAKRAANKSANNNATKKPLFQKRNGVSTASKSVIVNKKAKGLFGAKINSIKAKRIEKRAIADKGVTRSIFAQKMGGDGANKVAGIFANKQAGQVLAKSVSAELENRNALKYGTPTSNEEIDMRDTEVENDYEAPTLASKVPMSSIYSKPVSSIGPKVPQEFEDMEDTENLETLSEDLDTKETPKKEDKNKMLIIGVVVLVIVGVFFYFKSKKK